jgi:MoxR-like ATPase
MCDSYKESISKAIVLACVQAAHQQQRYCRVVAFGPKGTIMEAGDSVLRADTMGIQNLLNFLSNSLGGGTDVTGALKYAMTLLSSPNATPQVVEDDDEDVDKAVNCNNNNNDDGIYDMMAADLLLITDGEIPDPPVSDMVMGELMNLRQQSEVQIHGILVGHTKSNDVDNSSSKKAIKTLEKICTHVHDFLIDFHIPNKSYDNNVMHQRQRDQIISQKVSALRMTSDNSFHNPLYGSIPSNRGRVSGHRCRKRTRLFNRRKYYDDDDEEYDNFIRRDNSFDLDDDPFQSPSMKQDRTRTMNRMIRVDSDNEIDIPSMEPLNDYNSRVDHSVEKIKKVVHRQLKENKWKASDLDNEINNSKESLKSLQDQLRTAIQHVGDNLIERDIEARLVVLGMLAGEHVLLIGPPGTAKSALGRRLSKICGGLFFQRLLTRFTTPEEIFGPLSLRALENDEYRRCTDGFLPKASVAFLDEIFKANSAILNTLLTILNERQFDNGAGLREECPIRCVIAASNELPESDELEALYDRFLLRKEVLPISDDGVVQLLTTTSTTGVLTSESDNLESNKDSNIYSSTNPIDGLDRICESLLQAARRVQLETDISYLLRDLRIFLRDELNVNMSDRRLVKAAHLLKVSAATHGRTRVDPLDCLLLQHMAWNVPEQRDMIIEWLLNHITPGSMSEGGSKIVQCNILLNSLRQSAIVSIRRTSGDITGAAGANESDVAIISSIQLEVSQLVSLLQAESDALDRHIELLRRSMSYLWLDLDQARSLQQQLLPIAEQARDRNFRTLCHARALEILLTRDSGTETVVSNDIRLSAIEQLWDDDDVVRGIVVNFTEDELNMSMKEAKMKYADSDTFRRWKRERKKAGIK